MKKTLSATMYFKFWPEVRGAAAMIIERCHFNKTGKTTMNGDRVWFDAGEYDDRILLDGQPFAYYVLVRPVPRNMPGEGWKVHLQDIGLWYNVYEADGARYSLPKGQVRGFWRIGDGQLPEGRLIPPVRPAHVI
jgi:hypothetical protein